MAPKKQETIRGASLSGRKKTGGRYSYYAYGKKTGASTADSAGAKVGVKPKGKK